MAVHAPVHQLGTAHHPHTLRYALLAVAAAIVVVAVLVISDVVKMTPTSVATAGDRLTTPAMVQFRADERAVVPAAVDKLTTPAAVEFRAGERAVGQATGEKLLTPAMVQFRAEERAVEPIPVYNGPH